MSLTIADSIAKIQKSGKKALAILIDPDTPDEALLDQLIDVINTADLQFVFYGGSLLTRFELDEKIAILKERTKAKIITFPGSVQQVSSEADAILFLSLISGRNPEFLIGQHVVAAPLIRKSGIEALATGYMLIDSGKPTTASYMSGSLPIPHDKPDIAACTAMAGEMLGLKHIYLDAGSGAEKPVSLEMISAVRSSVDLPIIVGGGIRSAQSAVEICEAGADIVVVGNASEKNPLVIREIAEALREL